MSQIKPAEVSAILREQLAGNQSEADLQEVGTVLQVGDGIARIYGLSNVQAGELIEFENGVRGIALNLEEDNVGAVLLEPSGHGVPPRYNGEMPAELCKWLYSHTEPDGRVHVMSQPAAIGNERFPLFYFVGTVPAPAVKRSS